MISNSNKEQFSYYVKPNKSYPISVDQINRTISIQYFYIELDTQIRTNVGGLFVVANMCSSTILATWRKLTLSEAKQQVHHSKEHGFIFGKLVC